MNVIGIMQGRLSRPPAGRLQAFPWASWRDEFAAARRAGLGAIEWLLTADGLPDNPLWSDHGVAEIRGLAGDHAIPVSSVCADCFIDRPFVRVAAAARAASSALLTRVIERSAAAGIPVVLVPVLEGGAIVTAQDERDLFDAIEAPLAVAGRLGVCVALESDWTGDALRALIDRPACPALGAYYDVGNAASRGHDPARDLRALGATLRGVHIKDREFGGGSVALGHGAVDWPRFFAALAGSGYAGPLILETPAGAEPVLMARRNLAHVKGGLQASRARTAP